MPFRKLPFLGGYYYHIYNRGINHAPIFFCENHYLYLLHLMKPRLFAYQIQMVAYCLMPNHYHFLLRPNLDQNVHGFMKTLFSAYTQGVNQQQGRTGPLFQGRFRALLIDKEDYLAYLARYIHLNPVAAHLVSKPGEWLYSNYLDLTGIRSGTLRDGSLLPKRFATGEDYQRFVEGKPDLDSQAADIRKYSIE